MARHATGRPLPGYSSEIPADGIRIGACTGGGFGNAAEAAHPSKPLDVEGLDRPVWIDEEDGDHTASMIVDVQLSGHRRSRPHFQRRWGSCFLNST